MSDQQKISMGRMRYAYNLSPHEANSLIQALCPHAVFPLELWRKAHVLYWQDFVRAEAIRHNVECPVLPEIVLKPGKVFHTDLCAFDVMAFFRKLSLNIDSGILKKGLQYILAETFDAFETVFPEEREFLFSTLQKLEQRSPDYDIYDAQHSNEELLYLTASSYNFIAQIFPDTILLDTISAIRTLCRYPLRQEVKGLTRNLVNVTLDAAERESAVLPVEATLQSNVLSEFPPQALQALLSVPIGLWKGKTPEAICADMRKAHYANEVIAHVLFHRCGLTKKRAVGKLLGRPHLSDAAYDKLGKQFFTKSALISIVDTSDS